MVKCEVWGGVKKKIPKFFLHRNLKSIFKFQYPKEKNFKAIDGIEQYSTDAKLAELMHFCINHAEIKRTGHQTTIICHFEIIRRLVLCKIMKIVHSNIAKNFRNIMQSTNQGGLMSLRLFSRFLSKKSISERLRGRRTPKIYF